MLTQTQHDPKVSCPIVCSGYMRATGFFYRYSAETYLVTARHNLLPTNVHVSSPITGNTLWEVSTDDYLPRIDIYLRTAEGWEQKQVNLQEQSGGECISSQSTDLCAVSIHFDPATYGYRVFTADDISAPAQDRDKLILFGYPAAAFPQDEHTYSVGHYKNTLDKPYKLELANQSDALPPLHDEIGSILGIGLDVNPSSDSAYSGLSGAPVLGDDLLGVHSGTSHFPEEVTECEPELEDCLRTHFFNIEYLANAIS